MSTEPATPAVVEFGEGDPATDPDVSERFGDRLRRFGADRRVCLTVAVLAGVAGVASLVAPWYVTLMPFGPPGPNGEDTEAPLSLYLADGGSLGSGYVFGLLALAIASVLVLLGPPAARRVVRLAGLTLAAGLLPVLVGLSLTFGKSGYVNFVGAQFNMELDSGSGLTSAYLAVVLAGLALYLSGLRPASVGQAAPPAAAAPDRVWQPSRATRDETAAEVAAAAPLDLTVSPARPFTRPQDDGGPDR
ncbi:hypothetical protein [Asanoa sp. NPDC050611]|uniref:hypothetical protein n=1 Tax=Asanoa sp. NPDC050611 TaxID=3157098 RepID=UPI0033E875C1